MLTVTSLGNVKFLVEARGHKIVVDQPKDEGGEDRGMTPIELLAASLGSCIAYYVSLFCDRRKISIGGLKVEVNWSGAKNPHRVGGLKTKIYLDKELTDRERDGLLRYANRCTVHNTLHHPPKIEIIYSED